MLLVQLSACRWLLPKNLLLSPAATENGRCRRKLLAAVAAKLLRL
jgi:hypothetical protein